MFEQTIINGNIEYTPVQNWSGEIIGHITDLKNIQNQLHKITNFKKDIYLKLRYKICNKVILFWIENILPKLMKSTNKLFSDMMVVSLN